MDAAGKHQPSWMVEARYARWLEITHSASGLAAIASSTLSTKKMSIFFCTSSYFREQFDCIVLQ